MTEQQTTRRVVIVTGMAGAGRITALKALEDIGFEAVDNLPLAMLSVIAAQEMERDLAIGIDTRSRHFTPQGLLDRLTPLRRRDALSVTVLFLDCDDEVLQRRFTETRRTHPLALDRPVLDGIAHERQLLEGLRMAADILIDTTQFTPGDLRDLLRKRFGVHSNVLRIGFVSFSYKKGVPREADLVFDVRFLRNPHYVEALRPLTGRDPEVRDYVTADDSYQPFVHGLLAWFEPLLPRYQQEGKSYLVIAVGCTGGRHRSIAVSEALAAHLAEEGWPVDLRHRDTPVPAGVAAAEPEELTS